MEETQNQKKETQEHKADVEQTGECGMENGTVFEKIKAAFTFVRDSIPHSGDIQSHKITHTASEALAEGEGVCYVKSMLLAALLRSQGIAAGLCYQRLARANDHIIHALNGIYLSDMQYNAPAARPSV